MEVRWRGTREFLEQVLLKKWWTIFEGRIQFIVFMANRAIFTGTDATFSFDAATRPDCPHLLATTKSPRALIPSNKRIISVASARITGRNESSLLIPSFFCRSLFSTLPPSISSFLSILSNPPPPFFLSFFRLNQSAAIKWRSSAEIKGGNVGV